MAIELATLKNLNVKLSKEGTIKSTELTDIINVFREEEGKNPKEMEPLLKAVKIGGNVGRVIGIGVTALGGWLLGKWADSIANNDTRKHA